MTMNIMTTTMPLLRFLFSRRSLCLLLWWLVCSPLTAASVAAASTIDQQKTSSSNSILIHVPTMHCGHCAHKIQKALSQLPGVSQVQSNMYSKASGREGGYAQVVLETPKEGANEDSSTTTPQDLIRTISRTGFAMATIDSIEEVAVDDPTEL